MTFPGFFVNYTYAYNKDILSERGLQFPGENERMTWQKIHEEGKKLTVVRADGDVDIWGYYHGTNYVDIIPLIYQAGGNLFNSEDRLAITNEPAYEAVEWLHSLILDGVHGGSRTMFYDGKVATMRMGSHEINNILPRDLRIGVTGGIQHHQASEVAYVTSYTMTRNARHPEEAWRFLKFITSADSQNFVAARGRVPIRRDVIIPSDIEPLLNGFIQSIATARTYPYHIYSDQIQRSFTQMISSVWSGTTPVRATIAEIERTLNAFLDDVL